MATTKYLVDNLSAQTINGNVTINGNLNVTGTTTTVNPIGTYKALLTQTGAIGATTIGGFNGAFIIGETYTITDYVSGDDFSNIANVVSGTINQTNCEFIATGQTPTNWDNGSTLSSSGNLIATVLENNLGYNISWEMNPLGGAGNYFGYNSTTGYVYNNFNRSNVSVTSQLTSIFQPPLVQLITGTGSNSAKDDSVYLTTWNFELSGGQNNNLYYTPVQIDVKLDLDTTPIVLSGSVQTPFPFLYASTRLVCNGNIVENFIGDDTAVNNTSELIVELNTNPNTSYLGTYSDGGSGVILLSMPTNLVNQFCSNGTLSFVIFDD